MKVELEFKVYQSIWKNRNFFFFKGDVVIVVVAVVGVDNAVSPWETFTETPLEKYPGHGPGYGPQRIRVWDYVLPGSTY